MMLEKNFLLAFNQIGSTANIEKYFMYTEAVPGSFTIRAGTMEKVRQNNPGEYPPEFVWRCLPYINSQGVFGGSYLIINHYYSDRVLTYSETEQLSLKRLDEIGSEDNRFWSIVPLDNQSGFTIYSKNQYKYKDEMQAFLISHNASEVSFSAYNDVSRTQRIWEFLPEYSEFSIEYSGIPGSDSLLYMQNGLATNTLFISSEMETDDPAFTGREESIVTIETSNTFNGSVRFVGQLQSAEYVWKEIEMDVRDNLARDKYDESQKEKIITFIKAQLMEADPQSETFCENTTIPVLWLNPDQQAAIKMLFETKLLSQTKLAINFSLPPDQTTPNGLSIPFYILVQVREETSPWRYHVLDPTGVVGRLPR